MRPPIDRLTEIRDAVRDIQDWTAELDGAAFGQVTQKSPITWRAIKNAFTEIGEAIKGLPLAIRDRHPEIDWRGFAGLRNIVVHQYEGIDTAQLWTVITAELPGLLAAVEKELSGAVAPDDQR